MSSLISRKINDLNFLIINLEHVAVLSDASGLLTQDEDVHVGIHSWGGVEIELNFGISGPAVEALVRY